jgi:hypothetical protein
MTDCITLNQAIEVSGLKKTTILHHLHRGRFQHQRFGQMLALDRTSFEAFLAAHRAGAFPRFKKENAQ